MKTQKKLCKALKGPQWIGLFLLLTGWFMATPAATLYAQAATGSNQVVVAWGQNGADQLNLPATLSNVKAIDAGYDHGVALKNDGTVVVWGNTPQPPAGLNNVTAVAAGRYGTLALKNDGTVVAWGNANYGQLTVPAGLSGVTAIAMGDMQSLAVKQDGTVVAWGDSGSGMAVPIGLTNVVAVAASPTHNLALKRDGTVVAWGMSGSAGLNVPAVLNNVVAVAASRSVDLALKSDGTVVAWGSSDSNMQPPAGLNNVSAIDIDQYHAIALKRDGTVVKWGYPYLRSVPTYVSGATAVTVGYEYSVALVTDTTAPDTNFQSVPASPNANAAVFQFGGSDLLTNAAQFRFECSLNGAAFTACPSPTTYTGLASGAQTVAVRAKDAAGNVDASPATYTWFQCGDTLAVHDEASLAVGLACFKQRTTPGVFTIQMTGDISLTQTPVAENTNAKISLVIDGQNHAWDGQKRDLHGFQVKPGTTVTVQNLTIRGAYSSANEAGGVYNQGTLTLNYVKLDNNRSASIGGGLANYGTVTLNNAVISNNQASRYGGGIANWAGTATLMNSVMTLNSAYYGSGLFTNAGATTIFQWTNNGMNTLNGNVSVSGGQIATAAGGWMQGNPTIASTCYWLQNVSNGQFLTIPNGNHAPGTALVTAPQQTPTSGDQLWMMRGDNTITSLSTGLMVAASNGATDLGTPVVLATDQPGASSQFWAMGMNGLGQIIFFNAEIASNISLGVGAATPAGQPSVVLSGFSTWNVIVAPDATCQAALPVNAASVNSAAPATQVAAPQALAQLPADAEANLQAFQQVAAQPNGQTVVQAQQIYLPLINK